VGSRGKSGLSLLHRAVQSGSKVGGPPHGIAGRHAHTVYAGVTVTHATCLCDVAGGPFAVVGCPKAVLDLHVCRRWSRCC
jgi:hypothetical protein